MPTFAFETLDVFTDRRFGGNPLAVVTNAQGLEPAARRLAVSPTPNRRRPD